MQQDRIRAFFGIFIGLFAGVFFVMSGDFLADALHHFPKGVDPTDTKVICEWMAAAPMAPKIAMIASQFLAGLAAGWVANKICTGTRYRPAMVAGAGILAASIANFISIPCHPIWQVAATVILILLGAWLGGRAVPRVPIER